MDPPAVPPHWETTPASPGLQFRAKDLAGRQALKAFDDVYYRILPEHRVPFNSTIEIYAFQTDEDFDSFNHIAIWEKRENGARSRADAENWTLAESDETVFRTDGTYMYAAYCLHNEEINVVSLRPQDYYPLPPHWYYNDVTRSVVWDGFELTLPQAADAFDEVFRTTKARHVAHEVQQNHQIVLRVYDYHDEINGQDSSDVIACMQRPFSNLEWEFTYQSAHYDPEGTYAYIEETVLDDEGNEMGGYDGLPDIAFDFELDDEEEELVYQEPVQMEEFTWEESESDSNVMDIAISGRLLLLVK